MTGGGVARGARTLRTLIAAAIAASPLAAAAQGDAQAGSETREALLTALAMNECAVAEDETARVFGAQGFGGEFVRHELGAMLLDGTAFLEAGRVLRVPSPACPPAAPVPTPAQAFRGMLVERGCSIKDREAREIGIDTALLRLVVLSWLESGSAAVEDGTLTLSECE